MNEVAGQPTLTTESGGMLFFEAHCPSGGLFLKISRHLVHRRSPYQTIDFFETADYGRVMTLDRLVMLSERDEAHYHEMLVHVPMTAHPQPRRVLVVGGGDGGTLRELLRHPVLERVVQVEIDREVVELSRQFFPWAEAVYDHPKVELVIDDAADYIRNAKEDFDVVVVDSTDPIGPGAALINEEFYRGVARALRDGGLMSCQMGSPFYSGDQIAGVVHGWQRVFADWRLYSVHIPLYPGGVWTMGLAAKSSGSDFSPRKVRYDTISGKMKYYNMDIHKASFVLPEYLRRILAETG